MSITLLLDLDDTLFDNDVDTFLPAYFAALAEDLCDVVPPEAMLAALRAGVRQMMVSDDPARTLQQVFEAEFYPRLGAETSSTARANHAILSRACIRTCVESPASAPVRASWWSGPLLQDTRWRSPPTRSSHWLPRPSACAGLASTRLASR